MSCRNAQQPLQISLVLSNTGLTNLGPGRGKSLRENMNHAKPLVCTWAVDSSSKPLSSWQKRMKICSYFLFQQVCLTPDRITPVKGKGLTMVQILNYNQSLSSWLKAVFQLTINHDLDLFLPFHLKLGHSG